MSAKTNAGIKSKDKNAQSDHQMEMDDSQEFIDELEAATDPVAGMQMCSDAMESNFYRSQSWQENNGRMGPLSDVLGKAQRAYVAYLEAQKEVAKAYKVNEIQLEKAFREAERIADKACQEAIAELIADRQDSEQRAEQKLWNTVDQARQMEQDAEAEYKQTMDQVRTELQECINEAMRTRDDAIARAWEMRSKTVDRAWAIFLKETGTE